MDLEVLRMQTGKTREKIADEVGCHKQQVYNWEKDTTPVPMKYIAAYAKALEIGEQQLLDYVIQQKTERMRGQHEATKIKNKKVRQR